MFTPAELEKLDDRDLGVYPSGGYGTARRIAFLLALRDAFRKARLYDNDHPETKRSA